MKKTRISKTILIVLFTCWVGTNVFGQTTVKSEVPMELLETFSGFFSYTQTGGTLRNSITNECTVNTSSSGALSGIPAGATVKKAYLYWAGSGATDNTVTFQNQSVTALRTYNSIIQYSGVDELHFGCVADVTSIVTASGNTTYTFQDLTVQTANVSGANYCTDQIVLGGWALIVVYEDLSQTYPRKINIYEGWDVTQGTATVTDGYSFTMTDLKIPTTSPTGKITVLAWEGDSKWAGTATSPEDIVFNGNRLTDAYNPPNATNTTSYNAFNSTINTLSPYINFYGIDLDTYTVDSYLTPGGTTATIDVHTGSDLVFSNVAVMAVDIYQPKFEMTKTTSAGSVPLVPGQVITYTITIKNVATIESANNVITADVLPAGCTYVAGTAHKTYPVNGSYVTDLAQAPPALITSDDHVILKPGETLTVTFNVKVNDPLDPNITSLDNTASASADNLPELKSSSTSTPVTVDSDLELIKTVSNTNPKLFEEVTYTLTLKNNGPRANYNIVVKDYLPTDAQYVSSTPAIGTATNSSGVVTWDLGANVLAVNASTTLTIKAKVMKCGTLTNTAEVISSAMNDPNSTPNNGK